MEQFLKERRIADQKHLQGFLDRRNVVSELRIKHQFEVSNRAELRL